MACSRRGFSTIIATILTISLAVVGSAVYYVAVTGYMRPQPGLSPDVTLTVGASGFTIISAQIVNTGGIPFTLIVISIAGNSSQIQITYSSSLSAGGGTATVSVRGVSGGQYTALSPNTSVSGNLVASAGASYVVVIDCALSNGATFSQAISVVASP
jgi:FlaG/FlaF family flagellin (archaellin)